MEINRTLLIVVVLCLISIAITAVIGLLFKKFRVISFIPAIITFLLGIACYIKATFFATGFEDIGYILLAVGMGIFSLVSLATAVIIHFILKNGSNKI